MESRLALLRAMDRGHLLDFFVSKRVVMEMMIEWIEQLGSQGPGHMSEGLGEGLRLLCELRAEAEALAHR